jgi:hypothetical protein
VAAHKVEERLRDVVEAGVQRQCSKWPGDETCSQVGGSNTYNKFWAETDQNGNFYWNAISESSSHDGVSHTWQIWNASLGTNNAYDIYIDDNYVAASAHQIYPSGGVLQAGMELYSPPGINSSESSGSFTNTMYVWRVGQTQWNQSTLDTSTSHDASDGACGLTSNCAMDDCSDFAQGVCISWSLDTPNVWEDQKP